MPDTDRMVHAETSDGTIQVVRYDRQGRWYVEGSTATRMRLSTVHDAAVQAVAIEQQGGKIYTGRAGGQTFDSKVEGCRRRAGSR